MGYIDLITIDYTKHTNINDVPEKYKPIIDLIGLDNFIKLCMFANGDELYFPMYDSILRNTRKRLILQEYNGYNMSELSKKYNLSYNQIRTIIKSQN